MQNQSYLNCKIEYYPISVPDHFPITYPDKDTFSPSTGEVSYMHYHNNLEIGYCYRGCGIFFIDGRVEAFSAGDASIIFQNEIHIAQSDSSEPSQWKFVNIDPLKLLSNIDMDDMNTLIDILNRQQNSKNIYKKSEKSDVNSLIFAIISELEAREINYVPMIKSLTWSLLLKLSREVTVSGFEPHRDKHQQNLIKIAPALKYISDFYMTQISLRDVSQQCNISSSHLRRIFYSTMGISPSEYLYTVRIKMASILLVNLDESILQISLKVGYPTLSGFNRHFKRIMGLSPKEWRQQKTSKA